MIPEFQPFPKIARLNREIIITEKIDGTNAQVFIMNRAEVPLEELNNPTTPFFSVSSSLGDFVMLAGSRNRWISNRDDNYGFGRWVSDNRDELLKLGPGSHFGEWWGAGIQRRYNQEKKIFSLFNATRWEGAHERPACCEVVPVLYRGPFSTLAIDETLKLLGLNGSYAAPGFKDPEGIVIYHTAASQLFKVTLKNDEQPKSRA